MAKKRKVKPKAKAKKKAEKKKRKVGRPASLNTRLKRRLKTKEDIHKFGDEFGDCINGNEWPSFWCDKSEHFINMLACLNRKYVFKYHTKCSKCTQVFDELQRLLGDKSEDV